MYSGGIMGVIRWNDFESTSNNINEDFENLCRIFFKFHFVKNKAVVLSQRANNPGIETEPVKIGDKRVGFQAKYFTNQISYDDILDSAKKTVEYYSNQIDKVIIFCNKDINLSAANFKKAEELLAANGITVELCCNNNILDLINTLDEYAIIKALFFNKLSLTTDWFNKHLENSLKELGPKYTPEFHVDTEEWHAFFEVLYRTSWIEAYLQRIIDDAREELKRISGVEELKREIIEVIDGLTIPNHNHYEECLHWYTLFISIKQRIDEISAPTYEKWFKIINRETNCSREEINEVENKYHAYVELFNIIESFDLSKDKYLKYLNSNCLLIEGKVGSGKSHLLGYEAELHGNKDLCRSILLLGHKLVLNDQPQKQIMSELGLDGSTFHEFIQACEAKGEIDGGITVIMIDALNECSAHRIWKTFFNDIISEIEKYKYVRFVCSIRSTYKEIFFDDAVCDRINNREIPLLQLDGFRNILVNAVSAFFSYYNIPITTAAMFYNEFENPLFLRTYCEAYSGIEYVGSRGIFALYKNYIEKEEKKIKEQLDISNGMHYADIIFGIIGKYLFTNKSNSIPYKVLLDLAKAEYVSKEVIDAFLKSQIIVDYYYETESRVFVEYELYRDFIVSKYLIDNVSSFDELKAIVQKRMLVLDDHLSLRRHEVIGYFATLSVLAKEKYNKEIIDFLSILPTTDNFGFYVYDGFVSEYINAYHWRSNNDINSKDYFEIVVPYIKTNHCIETHIENMLSLAGRKCSLNAYALTKWLFPMSLAHRDHIWTIYINEHYNKGNQIYNTIQYFLAEDLINLTREERLIYGQELCWFLSASNRPLRDQSSRALVKVLKNNLGVITRLIEIFINVNDTYIISRLFCCAYGAILLSTDELDQNEVKKLASFIFNEIFNKEFVYPDILLRDYALNILEYFVDKGYSFDFPMQKCRPPYKSTDVPDIPIDIINKEYNLEKGKGNGTNAIKRSMEPDCSKGGFTGMYGDFGRYVFQYNLSDFKDIDVPKVFRYAFHYIVSTLGYDNKLFSEFDSRIGYGRSRTSRTERIGKKYEWMTMYHCLALVADHYSYEKKYTEGGFPTYDGEWLCGLRDFEPTLSLTKTNRQFDVGTTIHRERNNHWDLSNKKWADICGAECSFTDLIKMVDSNNEQWVALFFSITDKTGDRFDMPRQSIWRSSTGCLVRNVEKDNFIEKIKGKNFYGRWFHPIEVGDSNKVFTREFIWAPSYKKVYQNDDFIRVPIEIGKKKEIRKTSVPKTTIEELIAGLSSHEGDLSLSLELEEKEVEIEEPIYEDLGSILPCYHAYTWGDELDESVEEAVSYSVPHRFLIEKLNMVQINDGVWAIGNEIVCVDFSLVKNSNLEGLYIKQSVLEKVLQEGYSMVWIGLGEKDFSDGSNNFDSLHYRRSNLSSLIYESKEGKLIEIMYTEAN